MPFNKCKKASFGAAYFIGITQDVEMRWHAFGGASGKRLPERPPNPMDDEDTAKRFAYEMMEAFLGRKGERSKLPGFEDLAWQEEATPPWVVAHLRLFH